MWAGVVKWYKDQSLRLVQAGLYAQVTRFCCQLGYHPPFNFKVVDTRNRESLYKSWTSYLLDGIQIL